MELKHLTESDFEQNTNKGLVVVDFFATWCGPCKMLAPVLEQTQDEVKDVKIFKLDVDEAESIARKFGIMSVPSMVVLKDGEEIDRLVGFRSKDQLVEELGKYTQK